MTEDRPAAHVVVIDDEPAVRATLRDCLQAGGYRVTEAEGEAGLMAAMAAGPVDLVTLDLRLRGEDGLALAQALRRHSDVPIIIVTGIGEPEDRAIGLEAGADDYITKPFHVRELLARVANVLRRVRPVSASHRTDPAAPPGAIGTGLEPGFMEFDGWRLDCLRRRLESPERRSCVLTAAEYDLLRAFLSNPNRVLSRDEIMDLLKGPDWTANDRVIDNQVRRLRYRINGIDGGSDLIKSVRGGGYMLTAAVRGTDCDGSPPRVATPPGIGEPTP